MNLFATDLEILKSFVVFNDSANISVAAEKLKISQPLLTKRLQLFADEHNQKVFQFQGRKKILTQYGRALHDVISKGLNGLENELARAQILNSKPEQATIRIGGRKEVLESFASRIDFSGRLDFLPMTGLETLDALKAHRIELGVSQHQQASFDLVRKPFRKDSFRIVAPKKFQFASSTLPQLLKELVSHPYVSYGVHTHLRAVLDHFQIFNAPLIRRTFPSWPVIAEMCESAGCWSIIPTSVPVGKSVRTFEIPEKILAGTQFDLIYTREFSRTDWFQTLVKEIQASVSLLHRN